MEKTTVQDNRIKISRPDAEIASRDEKRYIYPLIHFFGRSSSIVSPKS